MRRMSGRSVFFYCDGGARDLHSFPTRRSSDLTSGGGGAARSTRGSGRKVGGSGGMTRDSDRAAAGSGLRAGDRKSTRLNSSHSQISYAVFCLKKKTRIPP